MIHTTRYPRAEYSVNNELTHLALSALLSRKSKVIAPYVKSAMVSFLLTCVGFLFIGYWAIAAGLASMAWIAHRMYRVYQKSQERVKLNCVCCQSPLHEEIYQDKSFFVCHWCRSFGKTKKPDER